MENVKQNIQFKGGKVSPFVNVRMSYESKNGERFDFRSFLSENPLGGRNFDVFFRSK